MRAVGGLRGRLAARAALLAAGGLLLVAAVLEATVVRPMIAEVDAELARGADVLTDAVASGGPAGFAARAQGWTGGGRGGFAALLRPGGGVQQSEGRALPPGVAGLPPGRPSSLPEPGAGEVRVLLREVDDRSGRRWAVACGRDAGDVRARQREVRWIVLAASVGAALLVAGGAWFGADLVLDPLGRFAAAARGPEAASGDLRLPVRERGDEFDDLARLLNELFERTRLALEEERRFAGEAAHELRAPLAVLRLRAEDALAEGDPATARAALEGCLADVDRIHRLVQALLELSRSGPGPGASVRCDLREALPPLAADLGALAASRGAVLAISVPPGAFPVAAPREIVETAVSVLVDNALRYGGSGVRVALRAEAREGGAAILVEDSGPGVPAAEAPRVFDRLYRGAAGRAAGDGFGLGLPLARRLARSVGGDVVLENPGSPGARFVVLLPAADPGPR